MGLQPGANALGPLFYRCQDLLVIHRCGDNPPIPDGRRIGMYCVFVCL